MIAQGKRCLAVGTVIALVASAGSAAPVIIDTFDSGSLSDAIFGYMSQTKGEAAAGIIDGWREVTVSGLGSGGGGSVSYGIAQGRIGLYTGTVESTYTGEWKLLYGPYNDIRMGKDLISGGNTGLVIDLISAEYEFTLDVQVVVAPLMGPHLYASSPATTYPANPQPHSIFVPFSAFTQDPGFTFTQVDFLTFTFSGAEDGDYVIDEIRADVPEPATLALMAAGAAAMIGRRRKLHAFT